MIVKALREQTADPGSILTTIFKPNFTRKLGRLRNIATISNELKRPVLLINVLAKWSLNRRVLNRHS